MDAFGGVVNTLQFIEFACKLVRLGKELYNNGALPENLHLEDVTSQLRDFNAQLKTSIKGKAPQSTAWTGQDKKLEDVNDGCQKMAELLLQKVEKLKVRGKHPKWNSFLQTWKTMWRKDEIEDLAKRLVDYREVLQLHLQARMVASSERSTTQIYSMESTFKAELQTITQQLSRIMPWIEARQHVSGDSRPSNGMQTPRPDVVEKSPLSQEIDCSGGHVQTNIATPAYGPMTPTPSSPTPVPAIREESGILTRLQEVKQQLMQHTEEHLVEHTAKFNAALAQRNAGEPPTNASIPQPLEDHESQEGHTSPANGGDLMTVLETLKGLISEEELFIFSKDARSILETLDNVFELFEEVTVQSPVVPEDGKRKRSESPEAADTLPRPHIKQARGAHGGHRELSWYCRGSPRLAICTKAESKRLHP